MAIVAVNVRCFTKDLSFQKNRLIFSLPDTSDFVLVSFPLSMPNNWHLMQSGIRNSPFVIRH
jgi:hypothetical protein